MTMRAASNFEWNKGIKEEIESVLARVKPSLGGASKQSKVIHTEGRYRKCA